MQIIILEFVYVKAIILKKGGCGGGEIAIEIRKGRYREKEKQYDEYGSPQIYFFSLA